MLTDSLSALQVTKAKVAELVSQVATERRQALAALPAQYGFADLESFIRALRETQPPRRARITDATRTEVNNLLAAGKIGSEIVAATGISRLTIQAIKKSLGLVKARKN